MKPAVLILISSALVCLAATPAPSWAQGRAADAIDLVSARVWIEGTSNLHDYTASTTAVYLSRIEIGGDPAGDALQRVLQPGALRAFEVVIRAAQLASPTQGIDRTMHRALKVSEYPEIRFQLDGLEPAGGNYRALGRLTIDGVERRVDLGVRVRRDDSMLLVAGETDLLMTDFDVKPPKAMLGLLRTSPHLEVHLSLRLVERVG